MPLRNGYTTGSCVAAAALAVWRKSGAPCEIRLPGGGTLTIPVLWQRDDCASVVKDGGDDPDVTTGCEIVVRLEPESGAPERGDFVERRGALVLTIRGGAGVGRVTRPGLAVEPGFAAINPAPRAQLADNLAAAGCTGNWRATIEVPRGAEVAHETLNPVLGITGGISILGHSGIVRPYSHAAYAATVALQLRSAAASGATEAALVTGNRTALAVARDFPALGEPEIVRIGDFIHVAVAAARQAGILHLIVGCMAGKLFKYACGERNTHAHQVKLDLARLREFEIGLEGVPLEKMDSMGELERNISAAAFAEVLNRVYIAACRTLENWAGGGMTITVALYDAAGKRIR